MGDHQSGQLVTFIDNGRYVMGYIRESAEGYHWFGLWRTRKTEGRETSFKAAREALATTWNETAARYPNRLIACRAAG